MAGQDACHRHTALSSHIVFPAFSEKHAWIIVHTKSFSGDMHTVCRLRGNLGDPFTCQSEHTAAGRGSDLPEEMDVIADGALLLGYMGSCSIETEAMDDGGRQYFPFLHITFE